MSSDLRAALAHIPALDRFPTVDEMQAELDRLAQRYPDLVRVRRIGTSRLGEPIRMATVGDGECDALVFGGPHANEPVGFLAVRELAWLLCAEAMAGVPFAVMPGLGVVGMISCTPGGSAGKRENVPPNCCPVGSVGGSCIGRSHSAESRSGPG